MESTPAQTTRRVVGVTIGGILLVLVIFLVITWYEGDPTNGREENQPSPSPSSAPALSGGPLASRTGVLEAP